MAYLDNPGPLDGGEVGDGTGFYQLGSYCRFLLAGILNGDLAAVPSHGAEEDVTLGHQGWMIRLLEGIQWRWSSSLWAHSPPGEEV